MGAIIITLTLVVVTAFFWWRRSQNKGVKKFLLPDAPRDIVILHQFGPAPFVPSISPFVIKLETFLRVVKVPYENRFDRWRGPKGKIPWLQYNDEVITDSQHCMAFINKTFQVDLNEQLTSRQQAVGHVIRRTLEEWMYWMLIMWRLVYQPQASLYRTLGLPSVFIWYMKRVSSSRALSQGIGLHSQREVVDMMKQDLNALDELLGERKFLFGDQPSEVTEFDCALFGQLCQLLWQTPDAGVQEIIQEEHPRLVAYCERMKEAFWPDWDERLLKTTKGQAAPETTPKSTPTSSVSNQQKTSAPITAERAGKNGHGDDSLASNLSFNSKVQNINNNISFGQQ